MLETRKRITSDKNVKILFSTMSFFYLQGFKTGDFKSMTMLHDILRIASPKYIALQLSQKDYAEKYTPIINHPQFPEIMDQVELLLKLKSEELMKIKNIDLNIIENLYCLDFCAKRKCKILLCGRHSEENEKIYQVIYIISIIFHNIEGFNIFLIKARVALTEGKKDSNFLSDIGNGNQNLTKEEIHKEVFFEETESLFVETIMKEMTPKFSIIPDVPYKTIVGVTKPENLEGISRKWKEKFKATYGHAILEDTEVNK